jgi:tellurite resistance protein TehA-like permease
VSDVGWLGNVFLQIMPTTRSARKLPNAIWPLACAIVAALALSKAMRGTGNDALDLVLLLAVLTGVVLSTLYTVRTWRRLSEHEFQLAHTPRWLMTVLALAVNGVVCFMVAGSVILILGVFLTGRGVAG